MNSSRLSKRSSTEKIERSVRFGEMRFSSRTHIELRPSPCADQCDMPASRGMAGRVSSGMGVANESRLVLGGNPVVSICDGSALRGVGPNSPEELWLSVGKGDTS